MSGQPTGIIKCLPPSWVEHSGGAEFIRSIKATIDSGESCWHMSFPSRPRLDVLHLYVVFDGLVQFRVNIMEFRAGSGKMNCYGGKFLARYWAICSGPMVIPKSPVPMKGFRGYRYTGGLFV